MSNRDVDSLLNLVKMIGLLHAYFQTAVQVSNQALVQQLADNKHNSSTPIQEIKQQLHSEPRPKPATQSEVSEKGADVVRSAASSGQKILHQRQLSGGNEIKLVSPEDSLYFKQKEACDSHSHKVGYGIEDDIYFDHISVGGAEDDPQEIDLSDPESEGESDAEQSLSVFYNNILENEDFTVYTHGFENRSTFSLTIRAQWHVRLRTRHLDPLN